MSFDPFAPSAPSAEDDDPFKDPFTSGSNINQQNNNNNQNEYDPFAPSNPHPTQNDNYDPFSNTEGFKEEKDNQAKPQPDTSEVTEKMKNVNMDETKTTQMDPIEEVIQSMTLMEQVLLTAEKLNTATSLFLEIQPCLVAAGLIELTFMGLFKLSKLSKEGVLLMKDRSTQLKNPIFYDMILNINDATSKGKTKTPEQWLLGFAGKTFTRKREIQSIIKRTILSLEKKGLISFEKPSLGGAQYRPSKLGTQVNTELWKRIKAEAARPATLSLKTTFLYLLYAAMPVDNEKTVLNLTKSEHDWRKVWKKTYQSLNSNAEREIFNGVMTGLSLSVRTYI